MLYLHIYILQNNIKNYKRYKINKTNYYLFYGKKTVSVFPGKIRKKIAIATVHNIYDAYVEKLISKKPMTVVVVYKKVDIPQRNKTIFKNLFIYCTLYNFI